tara:strand:- start:160 stop:456 length:297 start_codon:yes stop_codon:yes gene_type:complete
MEKIIHFTLEAFCGSHGIDQSFVLTLGEYELIELKNIENKRYIHNNDLPKLEKMLRLHQEMGINPEGIQAVEHLLSKVNRLQNEISTLKLQLGRFENE